MCLFLRSVHVCNNLFPRNDMCVPEDTCRFWEPRTQGQQEGMELGGLAPSHTIFFFTLVGC